MQSSSPARDIATWIFSPIISIAVGLIVFAIFVYLGTSLQPVRVGPLVFFEFPGDPKPLLWTNVFLGALIGLIAAYLKAVEKRKIRYGVLSTTLLTACVAGFIAAQLSSHEEENGKMMNATLITHAVYASSTLLLSYKGEPKQNEEQS